LDCHARLEKKSEKAVKLLKDALALLPKVSADNALLVSNLNANLGGCTARWERTNLPSSTWKRRPLFWANTA
jgi:hypothetical protein